MIALNVILSLQRQPTPHRQSSLLIIHSLNPVAAKSMFETLYEAELNVLIIPFFSLIENDHGY